jgi:HlyD family secretion protein
MALPQRHMAEPTKNRWWGWLLGGVVLVVGLFVIGGLASRGNVPTVQIIQPARENLEAVVSSNGKAEPINPFVVRAQFPTFVSTVYAKEGQAVRKGQLILDLDSADIRSQLVTAQSDLLAAQHDLQNSRTGGPPDELAQINGDLVKAQAQLKSLEQTRDALQKLYQQQSATLSEINDNALQLENARAALDTLQKRRDDLSKRTVLDVNRLTLRVQQDTDMVRNLETKVRSARVTAPVDGTLYSLSVRRGDYVGVGQELTQMADLRKIQVRAFVDEPDLGMLAPNEQVRITWDALPNEQWTGRTEEIPKQVVPHGSRSVGEVLCSVDNDKLELLPNINVDVKILVRQANNVLTVVRSAVRTSGKSRFLFVYNDDRIHRRDVSIGIASATKYEVLSGLNANDRVVLPGDTELKDGMEVRVAESK